MIMGVVEVIGAVAEAKPSAWVQSRSPSNTAALTPAFGKAALAVPFFGDADHDLTRAA